jgi:hypothetical protein
MLKAPTIYKGGSIVSALTRGGGGGGGQPKLLKIFTNFENFLHTGQLVKPKKGGGTKVQKKDCNWSTVVLYRIYRPSTVGKTVGTVVTLVLQIIIIICLFTRYFLLNVE